MSKMPGLVLLLALPAQLLFISVVAQTVDAITAVQIILENGFWTG